MKVIPSKHAQSKIENSSTGIIGKIFLAIVMIAAMAWVGQSAYTFGIHTQIKYLLQGRFSELPDGSIKDALNEITDSFQNETSGYFSNNLSTLYLDIPFKNVQTIQQKRDQAVKTGILLSTDSDFVGAEIRYNDSAPINVKIRLKGDWTDHLLGEKWSYRINITDDAAVEGMRKFSIQAPETRAYAYEWGYHQDLMRAGVLTPRYSFVNVVINGEYKGIYAMEESFSTELMESQQRRAGVLLRFDENDMWQNWAVYFSVGEEELRTQASNSGYFMGTGPEQANVTPFSSGTVYGDPILSKEYLTAQSLLRKYQLGQLKASEVFDLEVMGKYIAVSELWGAGHAMAWHNLRYYYNPVTSLLEPVGYDGFPMEGPYATMKLDDPTYDTTQFLRDPEIMQAFYFAAKDIYTQAQLDEIETQTADELAIYKTAMEQEYNRDVSIDWKRYSDRLQFLNNEIRFGDRIRGIAEYSMSNTSTLTLSIRNDAILPVAIQEISYTNNGNTQRIPLSANKPMINGFSDSFVDIPISLSEQNRNDISALDHVTVKISVSGDPSNFELFDFPILHKNPAAISDSPEISNNESSSRLSYPAGKWQIDQTIVVNAGEQLVINPGAELDFAPQAGILCFGDLQIIGTPDSPVILQGLQPEGSWKGILINKAESIFRIEHTIIKMGKQVDNASGAIISINDSSVTLTNIEINKDDGIGIAINNGKISGSQIVIKQQSGIGAKSELGDITISDSEIAGGDIAYKLSATNVLFDSILIDGFANTGIDSDYASSITMNDSTIWTEQTSINATAFSSIIMKRGLINTQSDACIETFSFSPNQFTRIQLQDVDITNCENKMFKTSADVVVDEFSTNLAVERPDR